MKNPYEIPAKEFNFCKYVGLQLAISIKKWKLLDVSFMSSCKFREKKTIWKLPCDGNLTDQSNQLERWVKYPLLYQKMELFSIIINLFQLLTIITRRSNFSCGRIPEAAFCSEFDLELTKHHVTISKLDTAVSYCNKIIVFFFPVFFLHCLRRIQVAILINPFFLTGPVSVPKHHFFD